MRVFHDPKVLADAIEAATERKFFIGIDLGTARDHTALVVLDVVRTPMVELHKTVPDPIPFSTRYEMVHGDRLPLQLDYTEIVRRIGETVNRPPVSGKAMIGYDFSGVGRPIGSMLKEAGIKGTGIQITGGTGAGSTVGGVMNVSKSHLMSSLLKTIHQRTLRLSPDMDCYEAIRAELQDLREHTSPSGAVKVEAIEGRHDDLALALAIAVYLATNGPRPASIGKFYT